MTQPVDADELLRRIRAARDWAAGEEERLLALAEGATDDVEGIGLAIQKTAFEVVRSALDEIIEPGTQRDGD
ncbi:hypothetical protein [Streptomyces sp. DSM 40750]|uniref:hypothetical protein n=1 Tax=Streptomyces sp. DSM 40750 TaxID=2801030 RepID=UPI00214C1B7E|nr:hypothetical protein [Streptomyces sp. DSM 40750]UUU21712.1 hypothetical protein JIX55_16020 [Streptomyces sp. DSM 40750]